MSIIEAPKTRADQAPKALADQPKVPLNTATKSTSTTNACRMCMPLGACLAYVGFDATCRSCTARRLRDLHPSLPDQPLRRADGHRVLLGRRGRHRLRRRGEPAHRRDQRRSGLQAADDRHGLYLPDRDHRRGRARHDRADHPPRDRAGRRDRAAGTEPGLRLYPVVCRHARRRLSRSGCRRGEGSRRGRCRDRFGEHLPRHRLHRRSASPARDPGRLPTAACAAAGLLRPAGRRHHGRYEKLPAVAPPMPRWLLQAERWRPSPWAGW